MAVKRPIDVGRRPGRAVDGRPLEPEGGVAAACRPDLPQTGDVSQATMSRQPSAASRSTPMPFSLPFPAATGSVLVVVLAMLPVEASGTSFPRCRSGAVEHEPAPTGETIHVHDPTSLQSALAGAKPCDHIVVANNIYRGDFVFSASGAQDQPIVLRVENQLKFKIDGTLTVTGSDIWVWG
jgi:hypothetical protein